MWSMLKNSATLIQFLPLPAAAWSMFFYNDGNLIVVSNHLEKIGFGTAENEPKFLKNQRTLVFYMAMSGGISHQFICPKEYRRFILT